MTLWSDRAVIVTGGAGALGSAVVDRLIKLGARVWVPCVDDSEAHEMRSRHESRVEAMGGVDLTNEGATGRFFAKVVESGPLWASIHIAGGFAMSPIEKTSRDDLFGQLELNAVTCFLCCREAVKAIAGRGGDGGRIVNVAARPALRPDQGAGMIAYTMSKAAVAALTASLAAEVTDKGILVNGVAPSIIDTPSNRRAMPDADFGRWPTPAEIAGTIEFLASPENRLTSGQIVPVYGRA